MASSSGPWLKKAIFILSTFCLLHSMGAMGQGTILDSAFTFRSGVVKTGNALNIITRKSGYNFTYDSHLINTEQKVDLSFSNVKLSVVLDSILQNDSLTFSVIDRYIIISKIIIRPVTNINVPAASLPESVSGLIVDEESGEGLPFATISLKRRGRGTVTNATGEFTLKIRDEWINDTLSVSFLGFVRRDIPVRQSLGSSLTIRMKREFISIPEIIIKRKIPQDIINKCVSSIPRNYGNTPAMMSGFYREGVMRRQELQVYSEAVIGIFKSSYANTLQNDQIKVFKSRKTENTNLTDTLAVRLKAGLGTCLELDGIKNLFDFISRENMAEYIYRISDIVSSDNGAAYVIDFEQREGIDLPRYRGSVYINTEDYAIIKAEFELHPKYIRLMKDSFVTSSSRAFSTWPVSVKYSVAYTKVDGRYYLSHVRGDLQFTSKEKKKLFSTQFRVFFELAITGQSITGVKRFEKEELAPVRSIFSETINNYDANFWGDQDFLKPEDNLLQALKNIKVKLRDFPAEEN